jgi:hypothetical protein
MFCAGESIISAKVEGLVNWSKNRTKPKNLPSEGYTTGAKMKKNYTSI